MKSCVNFWRLGKKRNLVFFLFVTLLLTCLICSPDKFSESALNGLILFATIIIPSLLPFFFFTRLFSSFEYVSIFSCKTKIITKKLFRTGGESALVFFLSCISGYPVGASLTSELFEEGNLSQDEAIRLASFSSNTGPAFLIGSIGSGMFRHAKIGYVLYLSHIIGAFLNGLLWRNYHKSSKEIETRLYKKEYKIDLNKISWSSIQSILFVGLYVVIFFVICDVAISLHLFSPITILLEKIGIQEQISKGFLCGVIEMTRGAKELSTAFSTSPLLAVVLTSFVTTFGGFSTYFQSLVFLDRFKMPKIVFLLQKTTHAIISSILAFIACVIVI